MDSNEGGSVTPSRPRSTKSTPAPLLPEIDIYIHLLVVIYLLDQKKNTMVELYCIILFIIPGTLFYVTKSTLDIYRKHVYSFFPITIFIQYNYNALLRYYSTNTFVAPYKIGGKICQLLLKNHIKRF